MKRFILRFAACFFLFALSAAAQGVRFSSTVTQQGTVGVSTNVVILPASPVIAFCTHPANAVPCTNKATTYTDQTLATPCSTSTQIVRDGTTSCVASPDAQNNWGVWFAPNSAGYDFTVTLPGGINLGPFNVLSQTTTISTIVGPVTISGALTVTGAVTATGANVINCKNLEGIRCIDSANTQGWAGSDIGGWVNSVNSDCPSTGCALLVAAGAYNDATAATITKPVAITCPGEWDATVITWTPATGVAFTFSTVNKSALFDGCTVKTSTSTTSLAVKFAYTNEFTISRTHLNGFCGGVWVTGDGTSLSSSGFHFHDNLIDSTVNSANCFQLAMDHVGDSFVGPFRFYANNNGSKGLIIDYGTGGLWSTGSGTIEQNSNAIVVQQTNQIGGIAAANGWGAGGGTYGGTPGAIFFTAVTADNSAGDEIVFDISLVAQPVRWHSSNVWARAAGRAGAGNCTAGPTAVGIRINGGSIIDFKGGNVTLNCGSGYANNSTGTGFNFEGVYAAANNQNNNATTPGILIGANPTNWRIYGVRSGNDSIEGGNQNVGLDWSAQAGTSGSFSENDFSNNTSQPIKSPAGLGSILTNAPASGGALGMAVIGGLPIIEQSTVPTAIAGADFCYGDSTQHALLCSMNNGSFTPLAGLFTKVNITPVTVNANVATDQNGMAITITAGALNSVSRTLLIQLAGVYSTPAASTTTLTHKLKLCTVSGCGSGTVITLASWTTSALGGIQATNNPYNCTVNSSTQTAGATAAFEAHGNLTIDLAALASAAEGVFADNNTATVGTIDSTAQLFLQHTIAFSAASGSNSATDRQMIADTVD
jgi:hypothetical protein